MGFSTTLGPNGWEPVDTQNADYAAAVVRAAPQGAVRYARTVKRGATYGDSRANVSYTHIVTQASGAGIVIDKVANAVCELRGDSVIVFNGGISGDVLSAWDSGARATQFSALIAAKPDWVHVQYGVNDIIGWNGVSPAYETFKSGLISDLKELVSACVGSGIPATILEAINPCAAAAASYIGGLPVAGGWGANAALKAQMAREINAVMKDWISGFADYARFADTAPLLTADDGFAKTDKTYADGTHFSSLGSRICAPIISQAITDLLGSPSRVSLLDVGYRNALNVGMYGNTSGRVDGFQVMQNEAGTSAADYSIVVDDDGDLCQQVVITTTDIGAGIARPRLDWFPIFAGAAPAVPVVAGDVLQGCVRYSIDGGALGVSPAAGLVVCRPRIFYDDATNEFVQFGLPNGNVTSGIPRMPAMQNAALPALRMAVKAAKASSNMLSTTALQLLLYVSELGTTRIRMKMPEWRKVA